MFCGTTDAPTPFLLETPTTPEVGCASTAMLEQEELAITEIPTPEITLPLGTDESIEKKNYQHEGSSNTAPRQLFAHVHEQTDEPNIHEPETTEQQDQTIAVTPPEEASDHPKDKTATRASKKPKV